ncbi:MAG: hypothetical protein ASARMPREDX12_001392 [Alectoria sarmentosa]|nr:MAG: hypothetical protein ASARMPREDX12_001392 [Alectoria sarmentosa]
MWPLGYILGSPYSPLNLEQQYPNLNWRDRFEDLLALESGNKMISAVSRQKEAATASRIRTESVHDDISHVNQDLQRNQDYVVLLQKLREVAVRMEDTASVSVIDNDALPFQKKSSEMTIANGKALIESLHDLRNKPASIYKKRVPWITSLISSGAMLGWESAIYDSADGWQADVYKADGSGDGQVFSELDLSVIFKEGHRLDFKSPPWSTYEGSYNLIYPQIEQLCPDGEADPDSEHAYNTIDNIRPSILSQLTTVQRRKSWNGSIETRVVLKNRFTDGREEEKTIVNDASKVLEEVEKAHASVKERHNAIGLVFWELLYRKQKEGLTTRKEMLDDGVD